ncbi:MAG: glutamine-hydrolyzing carbamoyl-phosphate synthase small subunit [Candidatus Omnitrophota bacterium]|jgi:carbamoyl-phosphate synthase small subunit|nr:glutamine-hydrolyzing carbamoyl-phosphate synthase small subunit [Candidatus Omnitrophota bacterium]
MKAKLVLEDGSVFEGISVGAEGEKIGEVVLNTAVVGYQEMVTDPTNAGKILVLTYPLIGNYGVAKKFNESGKCRISGLIIKESSRTYSNWQAEGPFEGLLKKEDVVTISDIDTRTLAIAIRDKGEMLGIVSTKDSTIDKLLKKLGNYDRHALESIRDISVKKPVKVKDSPSGANIAVLDLGIKNSFIKQLSTLGCDITLLPYNTKAKDILALKPDGLIISNGPENDPAIPEIVNTVKESLGKIPMMGIATGHEIIGLALGATLIKMKVGHHGSNYPIRPPDSFKGEITAQNHSYVIDEDSIKSKKNVTVTMRNVNDKSIEELESMQLKFISVQYDPASPGFDEVNDAFTRFLKIAGKPPKIKDSTRFHGEVKYAKA